MELSNTPEFKCRLNSLEHSVKDLSIPVGKVFVPFEKYITTKIEEEVWKQQSELNETYIQTCDNLALRELETEQVHEVLTAILSIYTWMFKDCGICELFFQMFHEDEKPVSLFSVVRF